MDFAKYKEEMEAHAFISSLYFGGSVLRREFQLDFVQTIVAVGLLVK